MLSEHVHAESLFITIPGGVVKEEFLISDDTGEKKQQINKKTPKHQMNSPKSQQKILETFPFVHILSSGSN